MNAKLGGTPWAVDNLPFMKEPTMICGMDVFHSTALGKKSVLALTASMNSSATTYWSTSVIQDEIGQEGSTNLQTGMQNALEAFKRNNGALPSNIVFYRDGVGEGQVQGICLPEVEQIKAAGPWHPGNRAEIIGQTSSTIYVDEAQQQEIIESKK